MLATLLNIIKHFVNNIWHWKARLLSNFFDSVTCAAYDLNELFGKPFCSKLSNKKDPLFTNMKILNTQAIISRTHQHTRPPAACTSPPNCYTFPLQTSNSGTPLIIGAKMMQMLKQGMCIIVCVPRKQRAVGRLGAVISFNFSDRIRLFCPRSPNSWRKDTTKSKKTEQLCSWNKIQQ